MRIEGFLAGRVEVCFALWGGLILVDGARAWTYVDCVGRTPRFTLAKAQLIGATEILKRLRALQVQNPEASIGFFVDSMALVQQLKAEWAQSQMAADPLLDAAIDLVRDLDRLTLRYCERRANLPAHTLIDDLCQRYGVPLKGRMVRR